MKVKFNNKNVNVKKLVQGAVVTEYYDDEPVGVFHISKFVRFNPCSNTVDLVVSGDLGKWEKNSSELTWPI